MFPSCATWNSLSFIKPFGRPLPLSDQGFHPYYQPAMWTPHITLAEHDIEPENLARIITRLASRPLFWEIPVGNLAIIWDTGTQQELRYQIPFQLLRAH